MAPTWVNPAYTLNPHPISHSLFSWSSHTSLSSSFSPPNTPVSFLPQDLCTCCSSNGRSTLHCEAFWITQSLTTQVLANGPFLNESFSMPSGQDIPFLTLSSVLLFGSFQIIICHYILGIKGLISKLIFVSPMRLNSMGERAVMFKSYLSIPVSNSVSGTRHQLADWLNK